MTNPLMAALLVFVLIQFPLHVPTVARATQQTHEVQRSSGTVNSREFSRRDLKIEAAFHALCRDPIEFLLLKEAHDLLESGVPENEVISAITQRRETLRISADDRERALESLGNMFSGTMGIAAAGLTRLALTSAGLPGIAIPSAVAIAGSTILRMAIDDWVSPSSEGPTAPASADLTDSPAYQTVRRTFEDPDFAGIWEAFRPVAGFSVDADVEEVLAGAPELRQALADRGMYAPIVSILSTDGGSDDDLAEHLEALEKGIIEELENAREAARANHEAVAGFTDQASEFIDHQREFIDHQRERWLFEDQRAREAQRRQVHRVNMENGRAVVRMAATVIGLSDADAGRQFGALGEAAFGVVGTLDAYRTAIDLGANVNLAAAALTANYVTIGLSLATAFMGGETIEQAILGEVRQLRQEMQQGFQRVHEHVDVVRREMRVRFDRLDGRLDDLSFRFDDMDLRFDEVLKHITEANDLLRERLGALEGQIDDIGEIVADLEEGLTTLELGIERLHKQQLDIYMTLVKDHDRLEKLMVAFELDPCMLEGRIWSNGYRKAQFVGDCLSDFETATKALSWRRGVPESPDIIDMGLTSTMSLDEFQELHSRVVGETNSLPRPVVSPAGWFLLMEDYERFLVDLYPEPDVIQQYGVVTSSIRNTMAERRSEFERYFGAIRDELLTFQNNPGNDVFSMVFKDARDSITELNKLLLSIEQKYYADNEVTRTRRDDESGVLVAELNLRNLSWTRMEDFYRRTELAEWIRVHRYGGCSLGIVPRDDVLEWSPMARDWFRGDGILHFLDPNDLGPARIGLGQIEACVTGMHLRNENRARLAVEVWFNSGNDAGSGGSCGNSRLFYGAAEGRHHSGFDLSNMLLDVISGGRKGMSNCQEAYLNRVEEKQQAFSDYMRSELSKERGFRDIARDIRMAGAHIRAWIALAFDARMRYSVAARVAASGVAGFPDLEEMLTTGSGEAWRLAEDAEDVLAAFEEFMRSGPMRGVAEAGYAHRHLTETRFEALGD